MLNVNIKQYLEDVYINKGWGCAIERKHYFDIYNRLVEFVNTEIEGGGFILYGKLDNQLYEAILAEVTYLIVCDRIDSSVTEILEDNIDSLEYDEVMQILSRYIVDFKDLYEHEFKGESRFSNEKNSINDRAALSICMMIIKAQVYKLESKLYPVIEKFKIENKTLLEKIRKELEDN